MASLIDLIKHFQHTIEKYPNDEQKVLKCIDKLYQLGVTVQHLQDTGVGRTVNALRKEPGDVGNAARALVNKWKLMVAAEEKSDSEDHNHDTSNYNGQGNRKDSDDNLNQSRNRGVNGDRHDQSSSQNSKHNDQRHMNGDHSGSKRKYHSSEEEPDAKKSKHNKSEDVQVKTETSSQSESDLSDSQSDSDTSASSEEEVKVKKEIKTEPPEKHHSSSKHSHQHAELKKETLQSPPKRHHDTSDRHSKHKTEHKQAEESSSKDRSSSSSRHKSPKEKESSSDKKHNSDHKDKDRSSSSKQSSSIEKHKSSSSSNNLESSDKHRSKSEKKDSKSDKHSSHSHKSDKEKHKRSEKEIKDRHSKEASSSSGSKEKHSSSEKERSHKSSSSKDKLSQSYKSDKDKKSSSESKDSKSKADGREKESHSEKSSSSHKKSKSKEGRDVSKNKKTHTTSEDSEDGIDCGSGASFAEALGMISPAKPKKKTTSITRESLTSPLNSFLNDLGPASLLAPTAQLTPLPPLEISALPEISPNYKPRPPPKLLPHFTDEEAISAGISSKNQRTKVYSGNKTLGKVPSLYELCVNVLQEHIDALEYTGGVPYEILKPVVDKATPQQLFVLEHYNPYLIEDTDHLWQKFCEKHFRIKKRQEMESWREMYMRCQEEQEHKLKSLTANIKIAQEAKKAPIKQTKMAYVDSVVKPPRNIARKQAQHGTARTASASPAARVAALATTANVARTGCVRPPPAAPVSASAFNRPKKAPLMQKALQLMRGGRKR